MKYCPINGVFRQDPSYNESGYVLYYNLLYYRLAYRLKKPPVRWMKRHKVL